MSNGIHTIKIIAGEVPLPEDGSFYLEVPSGLPFYLQTLNADRMAVRTFDKLIYTVPGEKLKLSVPRSLYPMICGGCHGGISGRRSDVLRRPDAITSASKVIATWDPEKRSEEAAFEPRNRERVVRVAWTSSTISNRSSIASAPLQDAISGSPPAAGLSLTAEPTHYYNDAYESLMLLEDPDSGDFGRKKYVEERECPGHSELSDREALRAGTERPPATQRSEPPHPVRDPLSEEERLTFVRWIDLGAPFKGFVPPS